ncbi:MAG: hypothetical protein JRI37_05965 [Deltaproteobacteria bacterium]|nr:hypothetical protein [Deltaproteobacteria bacterium]
MDNSIKNQYIDLAPMDLSEEDVLKAMKDIPGYLERCFKGNEGHPWISGYNTW